MTYSEYSGNLEYMLKEDEDILWSGRRHHHVVELEYQKAKKAPLIILVICLVWIIPLALMMKELKIIGLVIALVFGLIFGAATSLAIVAESCVKFLHMRKYIEIQPSRLDDAYMITSERVLVGYSTGYMAEMELSEIRQYSIEMKDWYPEYGLGDIELTFMKYSGAGVEESKIELEAVLAPEYVQEIITKALKDYRLKKQLSRW